MTFRLFCFVSHFFVLNYMPSLALDVPVNRHMSCICCSDKKKKKKTVSTKLCYHSFVTFNVLDECHTTTGLIPVIL